MAASSSAAGVISALQPGEEPGFVAEKIKEKALHVLICDLNSDMLSKDPERMEAAQTALQRIGFA